MEQHRLHNLAEKYERQMKKTIAEKFSVSPSELVLLTDKENGVYISREDPTTFCCMVVGRKSKFLYLATAHIDDTQETLSHFGAIVAS